MLNPSEHQRWLEAGMAILPVWGRPILRRSLPGKVSPVIRITRRIRLRL
jgi:hypothetical protein